jgi:hypothetical protein
VEVAAEAVPADAGATPAEEGTASP